jgi:hypothetical protein
MRWQFTAGKTREVIQSTLYHATKEWGPMIRMVPSQFLPQCKRLKYVYKCVTCRDCNVWNKIMFTSLKKRKEGNIKERNLWFAEFFSSSRITSSEIRTLFWNSLMHVYKSGSVSSGGIVTDYGLECPGSNPGGDEIFGPSRRGPGAHSASCKTCTGSFPRVQSGRSVLLATHHFLVPRSWKSKAIPLPTLWATPGL